MLNLHHFQTSHQLLSHQIDVSPYAKPAVAIVLDTLWEQRHNDSVDLDFRGHAKKIN